MAPGMAQCGSHQPPMFFVVFFSPFPVVGSNSLSYNFMETRKSFV